MVKKNAIYIDKTQRANFRYKPLFQATKEQLHGKKLNVEYLSAFDWAVLVSIL